MTRSYWLFGARVTVLADSEATGAAYDLAESLFPPAVRTPLHRHTRYQEQLYVLEGEFTVWTDERTVVLRPGDSFIIPVGTVHAVGATGGGPARGLVVASPSGFARLIAEVGTPHEGDGAPPPGPTDVDLFLCVSAELGDELVGPPGTRPD